MSEKMRYIPVDSHRRDQQQERDKIAIHVSAFLSKGGKVQQIATGVGMNQQPAFVLNQKKKLQRQVFTQEDL